MTNICMHSSHYTGITVVHPLLGYVHKYSALRSLIMAVLQFSHLTLTILLKWVGSLWGKLDHTRLHSLWSNPQNPPLIFLLAQLLIRIVLSSKLDPYIKTIRLYKGSEPKFFRTPTNLFMIPAYLYLYRSSSSANYKKILQKPYKNPNNYFR